MVLSFFLAFLRMAVAVAVALQGRRVAVFGSMLWAGLLVGFCFGFICGFWVWVAWFILVCLAVDGVGWRSGVEMGLDGVGNGDGMGWNGDGDCGGKMGVKMEMAMELAMEMAMKLAMGMATE